MSINKVTITTTATAAVDLSFDTLYASFAASTLQQGATGYFMLVEGPSGPKPGYKFLVTGTGFTYDSSGITGGTVTGFEFLDPNNGVLATFSGFNIDAVSLSNAISAYGSSGDTDPSALNAIFLATSGQQYDYTAVGSPGLADKLQGGSVADTLYANGPSTLIGGSGVETFVYTGASGAVTINNFQPAQGDVIDLTVAGVTSASTAVSDATLSGGNTVINFGSGQTITLAGFTGSLTTSDFQIVPLTITPVGAQAVVKDSTVSTATASFTAADNQSGAKITWSLAGAPAVHAPDYSVTINEFTVVKGGTTEFDDTFTSSTPPNYSGTTTAAQMSISGVSGTSSNVSVLSGANAVSVVTSTTDPFLGQFATLISGTSGAHSLVKGTAFSVSGTFALTLPTENRNSYGIQLNDKTSTTPNDEIVRLFVVRTADGKEVVSLNEVNGVTGSNHTLQSFVLSPSAADQQIQLTLSYDPANENNVSASFSLLGAGGVVDSTTSFTATGHIFDTQNFTQAQYFAQAPATSDSVVQGTYGTFDITQAGALTYALDNSNAAVTALTQGQSLTDTATVQAADDHGATASTGESVNIDGASPQVSVTISGSGAPVAPSFSQFLGFGDSNIDSGYFFNTPISNNAGREADYQASVSAGGGIPTSLGGTMNSTLLAQDYGLSANAYNPNTGNSGSALGTNYAASGATVTGSLKGSLAPSITSQITTYLNSVGNHANANALYLISGGGNDAKIAADLPGMQGEQFMVLEANALAGALIQLHNAGAQYIIIDNQTGRSTYGDLFNTVLDSALGDAGVPFINADVSSLIDSIQANPSAYNLLNVDRGVVGTSSNPYNQWAGGADINPDTTLFSKGWALYATQLVSADAGSKYLWADDEHLSAIGQQIEANYDHNLVQTSTPLVGETLTADPALVNGAGSNFTYQWQSRAGGSTTWNDIVGQQGSSYVVQHGDIGDQLRVEVSFIDAVTGQTASAFSAPTFDAAPCYCPGTSIRLKKGERRVEKLKIGDHVMTKSGVARRIKWIGRRSYGGRFIQGRKDILPICIKAGALEAGIPRRDLWISPRHAMYLDDVLIEAKDLVNGVSIVQAEDVDSVEYFHVELDSHDVIIAEGALSESFVDDDSRAMFHNARQFAELYPDEPALPVARYCAPRLQWGYEIEKVRQRIAARAGLPGRAARPGAGTLRGFVDRVSADRIEGWAQNADHPDTPVCLDILAGHRLLGQVVANRYRDDLDQAGIGNGCHAFVFALPEGVDSATIDVQRSLDGAPLARADHARSLPSPQQRPQARAQSPAVVVFRRNAAGERKRSRRLREGAPKR